MSFKLVFIVYRLSVACFKIYCFFHYYFIVTSFLVHCYCYFILQPNWLCYYVAELCYYVVHVN